MAVLKILHTGVYSTCSSSRSLVVSCFSTKRGYQKSIVQSKGVNRNECARTFFFFLKCLKRQIKNWLKSFHVTPTEARSLRRSGKITLLWSNSKFSILNNSSVKKKNQQQSTGCSVVHSLECVAAVSGRVQGRSRSGSCPGRPNHFCCKIYGPSSSRSPGKGDSKLEWRSSNQPKSKFAVAAVTCGCGGKLICVFMSLDRPCLGCRGSPSATL